MIVEKFCKYCGKSFLVRSDRGVFCKIDCYKKYRAESRIKTYKKKHPNKTGRKKGCIPWNKGKKCPQLSGKNAGFYGKHHTDESKEKLRNSIFKTKKENNSFNKSQEEQKIKKLLLNKFKNLKCQYKSKVYPFACDFYIPSLDLYVEYQGFWTHGQYNHKIYGPFDKNNNEHVNLLNIWIDKSKTSNFYKKAIHVWTESDPLKRETAKKNNLNWIEFFTMDQFMEWYNKQ